MVSLPLDSLCTSYNKIANVYGGLSGMGRIATHRCSNDEVLLHRLQSPIAASKSAKEMFSFRMRV